MEMEMECCLAAFFFLNYYSVRLIMAENLHSCLEYSIPWTGSLRFCELSASKETWVMKTLTSVSCLSGHFQSNPVSFIQTFFKKLYHKKRWDHPPHSPVSDLVSMLAGGQQHEGKIPRFC